MSSNDGGDRVPWIEVLVRMVDGPTPPHRGRIRSRGVDGLPRKQVGWAVVGDQSPPTIAGGADDAIVTVWRDQSRVRIEGEDGQPIVICDGEQCWRFRPSGLPTVAPAEALQFRGSGTELLARRAASEWVGDDFTRPMNEVRRTLHLGRDAWSFDLEPPAHKPHPLTMVVDAASGLTLSQGVLEVGLLDEWTEFEVLDHLNDELFTWSGATEPAADRHRRERYDHEDVRDRRTAWFRRHVTDSLLRVEVSAPFDVQYVHELDESTGEFFASLGEYPIEGSLARRRHSEQPWPRGDGPYTRLWVSGGFDWVLTTHNVALSDGAFEAVRRLLDGEFA